MKADFFEIPNFVSSEFCHTLVKYAETVGFIQATADVAGRSFLEYRNNLRLVFDDKQLAETIWNKKEMQAILPRLENPGWKVLGFNERFKVYKYLDTKQHYFASHYDGNYERIPMYEQSWMTLLVYLNDVEEGGETVMTLKDGEYWVKPVTGHAAFMTQNNILHEAMPVKKGVKYALRTDIMYRKINPDV